MRAALLCLLMLAGLSFKPTPTLAQAFWVQTESGDAIVTDASGNTYSAGNFHGTVAIGGAVLQAATTSAFGAFLAKYNPQGALLWVRQITGSAQLVGIESIALDGSGNVLIGGEFEQGTWQLGSITLAVSPAAQAYSQGYVAQLDPAGTIMWAQATQYAGLQATVSAVAVDAGGTVYGAGSYYGSGSNSAGAFIRKYSASGVVQVASTEPGGTGSIYIMGLAVSANGQQLALAGRILGGSFTLRAATGSAPALTVSALTSNSSTGFVAGYSSTGAAQWVQSLTCGNNRGLVTNVVSSGADFLASGIYTGTATLGSAGTLPGAASTSSGMVARFSGQGAVLWAQPIAGNNYIEAYDVAADASGNAYVVGHFDGQLAATAGGLASVGGTDAFLLKYSQQGVLLGTMRDGGAANEYFGRVALTASGQVRLGGYYNRGTGTIAGISLPSNNVNTSFVGGLGTLTLVTAASIGKAASLLTAFPNPTRQGELLHLNFGPELTTGAGTLRLLNVLGQQVHLQPLPAHGTEAIVPTAGLAAGHYVLQLITTEGAATRGVVIQ